MGGVALDTPRTIYPSFTMMFTMTSGIPLDDNTAHRDRSMMKMANPLSFLLVFTVCLLVPDFTNGGML